METLLLVRCSTACGSLCLTKVGKGAVGQQPPFMCARQGLNFIRRLPGKRQTGCLVIDR
jgi:hypothetical protein